MNTNIERIYQERVKASRYNPTGFTRPFSIMDLEAIETWLAHEQCAEAPDMRSWEFLFTNTYPFYRCNLNALLQDKMIEAVIASSDPIEEVQDLSIWDDLEEGMQLLLEHLDLSNLAIFDARYPIFVDREDIERAFWLEKKMENGYHGEWTMSRLPVGEVQVMYAMLQSWLDGGSKAEQARKLCGDLLQACLDENRELIQGAKQQEAPPRAKTLP